MGAAILDHVTPSRPIRARGSMRARSTRLQTNDTLPSDIVVRYFSVARGMKRASVVTQKAFIELYEHFFPRKGPALDGGSVSRLEFRKWQCLTASCRCLTYPRLGDATLALTSDPPPSRTRVRATRVTGVDGSSDPAPAHTRSPYTCDDVGRGGTIRRG
ncbi:hypothetical protein J6590_086658 [Homalodisca vitripennis]|nr:hypothetical protein J6590_086658 [Homalodisca vitripennis]